MLGIYHSCCSVFFGKVQYRNRLETVSSLCMHSGTAATDFPEQQQQQIPASGQQPGSNNLERTCITYLLHSALFRCVTYNILGLLLAPMTKQSMLKLQPMLVVRLMH